MDLRGVLISVCVFQFPMFFAAPSSGRSSLQSADAESLRNVITKLQNAVNSLKDFSESLHEASSNSRGGDSGSEYGRGKLQDLIDELSQPRADQLPSLQRSSDQEEVSLKDAIEYLVALAKQKKQEKRDHDIPFPLSEKTKD